MEVCSKKFFYKKFEEKVSMASFMRAAILFALFAHVLSVKFYVKQGDIKCIGDDVRKVFGESPLFSSYSSPSRFGFRTSRAKAKFLVLLEPSSPRMLQIECYSLD